MNNFNIVYALVYHVFFLKKHISLYFYKCKILYKGPIDRTYSPDCTNCQLCLSIKTSIIIIIII
jgi:hypothetical protein